VLSGLLVASFVTFLSERWLARFIPAVSVDRTLKGDRLPLEPLAAKALAPSASQTLRDKIPIGCDRAFSPISAPRLANVFRRCAA